MSFSRNVPECEKQIICQKIKVKTVTSHTRYLGLPVIFGRSKKEIFSFVQERIWKKVKGWKEKCLSRAGKETLIKSVAQAIPNYIMSCYKIPETCCKAMESVLAKFWWGTSEESRKVHWVSWEKMGAAKSMGGLGFRSFSNFNRALLGKQCWRLLCESNSLMARVFKSKYYPRSDFMSAGTGYLPSYAWRSLLSAKEVIEKGALWKIGNGCKVSIYGDRWLPGAAGNKIQSIPSNLLPTASVSELINHNTKQWDRNMIHTNFSAYEAKLILSIPLSWRLPEDEVTWYRERNGIYSVRSGHHQLVEEERRGIPEASSNQSNGIWRKIWSIAVPKSTQNFLWRLVRNILPNRCNLAKKGIQLDMECPLCHTEQENQDHLFMNCAAAKAVWFASPLALRILPNQNFSSWIAQGFSNPDPLANQLFGTTLWMIWRYRNKVVFDNISFDPLVVVAAALNLVVEFNSANACIEGTRRTPSTTLAAWSPPPENSIKINVDAGCFSNESTGFGMIARNSVGTVIFAATNLIHSKMSPLMAEAFGLRWCIDWAKNQDFESLIVETDSETVAKCIQGKSDVSEINLLILDCLDMLNRMPNTRVSFANRSCNQVAHGLARYSKSIGSFCWEGNVPAHVYHTYCNDLPSVE